MKISGYILQKQPCRNYISPGLFVIFELGLKIVLFCTEAGSSFFKELQLKPDKPLKRNYN